MFKRLRRWVNDHAVLVCCVGFAPWLEAFLTVHWTAPNCSAPVDGPVWPASGFPFPYQHYPGATSLQRDLMPHLYLLALLVYAMALVPLATLVVSRFPRAAKRLPWVALLMSTLWWAALGFEFSECLLVPVWDIGDSYAPYFDYRPASLGFHHWPPECLPEHS